MALEWKKNDKFEHLGTLEDFFKDYGDCHGIIGDINEPNIKLNIKSEQEIEFTIYCSKPLSEIIRNSRTIPEYMNQYNLYRIIDSFGNKYIRVTQEILVNNDPNLDLIDNAKLYENIKGSVKISFNLDEIEHEKWNPKEIDNEDLIRF